MRLKTALVIGLCLSTLNARAAFTISFDYTYDTTANGGSGLFTGSNAANQVYLNAVGGYISSLLSGTSMSAITPSGGNTWQTTTFKPGSPGTNLTFNNPSITADTVVVYVGSTSGSNLGGSLAVALPGNVTAASGTAGDTWNNLLDHRGNGNYYMPWGGSISFNAGVSWYFDNDITTVESASMAGKNDFVSVAAHELFHLLGFGTLTPPTVSTTTSWATFTNTSTHVFTGPNSIAAVGLSSVSLGSDNAHWTSGLSSYSYQNGAAQEAMMDPSLTQGDRKYPTTLDMAAMKDIGYTVTAIPEPAEAAALLALGGLLFALRRRLVS